MSVVKLHRTCNSSVAKLYFFVGSSFFFYLNIYFIIIKTKSFSFVQILNFWDLIRKKSSVSKTLTLYPRFAGVPRRRTHIEKKWWVFKSLRRCGKWLKIWVWSEFLWPYRLIKGSSATMSRHKWARIHRDFFNSATI